MRLNEESIGSIVAASLVILLVIIGVYLWSIDLLTYQKQFAILLAAELVGLSLLLYLRWKQSYREVRPVWLMAGCASLAILLAVAAV